MSAKVDSLREGKDNSESDATCECDVSCSSTPNLLNRCKVWALNVQATHFPAPPIVEHRVLQVYDKLEEVVASPDFLFTINRSRVGDARANGNCSTQLVHMSGLPLGTRPPILALNEQHFQTVRAFAPPFTIPVPPSVVGELG